MEQVALYCVSPKTAFTCPPSRYVAEVTGAHEWFSMQSYSQYVPYHGTSNNYFIYFDTDHSNLYPIAIGTDPFV